MTLPAEVMCFGGKRKQEIWSHLWIILLTGSRVAQSLLWDHQRMGNLALTVNSTSQCFQGGSVLLPKLSQLAGKKSPLSVNSGRQYLSVSLVEWVVSFLSVFLPTFVTAAIEDLYMLETIWGSLPLVHVSLPAAKRRSFPQAETEPHSNPLGNVIITY